MKWKYSVVCILLGVIVISGCDSGDKDPVNDYDYFPLRLGHSLVYRLTETRYSAGNPEPVISTWLEKDEAIRRTESLDGFPVFTFARSRRNNPADAWQKVKEYTVTQYPDKYLRSIDNVTTAPMVFPVRSTTSWNINAYNSLYREDCYYDYINEPRTIGGLEFKNTIQVTGRDSGGDTIVAYNLGYSQYALKVGLIYDEQTDYEYCQEGNCLGQKKIASGISTIRELIDYEAL